MKSSRPYRAKSFFFRPYFCYLGFYPWACEANLQFYFCVYVSWAPDPSLGTGRVSVL